MKEEIRLDSGATQQRVVNRKGWRGFLRVLGILLGLFLLWAAFRGVDFDVVVESLRKARPIWLVLSVASVISTLLLKTVRWWVLLRPVAPEVGLGQTFGVLMVGQAGNTLLPSRSGDVARVVLISSPDPQRAPAVLTGIVIEKALDAIFFVLVAVVVLPGLPVQVAEQLDWRTPLAIGLVGLVLSIIALMFTGAIWSRIRPLVEHVRGRLGEKLVRLGDQLVQGMEDLRQQGKFGLVLGLSLLIWLNMAGSNYLLAQALSIPSDFRLSLLVLLLAFVAVIPGFMPGHIGVFNYFISMGLDLFGVEPNLAAAYSVLLYFLVFVPPVLAAGVYLLIQRKTKGLTTRSEGSH